MEKYQLHETLQQLHEELEETPKVDDNVRELLRSVMQDIQRLLDEEGGPSTLHHRSLIGRLEEATTHFEASYPNLTAAAGRVIEALSSMGI